MSREEKEKEIELIVKRLGEAVRKSPAYALATKQDSKRTHIRPDDTFDENSPAHGLGLGEFENLSEDEKQKLIRMMARMTEAWYRRGYQQGVDEHIRSPEAINPKKLGEWRYGRSLDESIGANGSQVVRSSIHRLFMENRFLCDIGFAEVLKADEAKHDSVLNGADSDDPPPSESTSRTRPRKKKHDDR